MSEPWFDPNTFGALYGGLVGGVGGSLAGVLGALAGTLAPRGKGKIWILGGMVLFILFGLVNLAIGLYALLNGQPYAIWSGPLLVGCIFTVVIGAMIPVVRLRYRQAEQRHFEAESFRAN
jgi:multidrug transporter EmrE-like cation transporter